MPGQASCVNAGLATCTRGTNGCYSYATPVACAAHQSCTGVGGSAKCTCNQDPVCGVLGTTCASKSTLATCSADPEACTFQSSTTPCTQGACTGAAGLAACCANACTGAEGLATTEATIAATAAALGCAPENVLIASTGVIGVQLSRDKILAGVKSAVGALSRDGATAARGIMTTDLAPKEHAVHVETARGVFHVGGIAKGAGMIEPMLATMLSFITTDAAVPPALLERALREVTSRTFNAITVDGECSTNDTLAVLASGASGVTIDESSYPVLVAGLEAVARTLALAIVRGGEGATKLVAIHITGAVNDQDAMRAAKTIANSPLVKTAVHGGDPNWGRLVAASGRSGARFVLEHATVEVGDVLLFRNGQPYDENAPEAAKLLQDSDIDVHVDLGTGGSGEATAWTCDLSAEYVRINGEYRT
jgi:glutamate N-acetyltransferase/amino-acid N-acetyltransferase